MAHGLRLSTDDVPAREAAAAWRDWMGQLFFGLDSHLYGDAHFEGHLQTSHAGQVILTQLEANRHDVMRDSRPGPSGDAAYLKIVAPLRGCAGVAQHGRKAWVRPGGWAIYDTTASYQVTNPERCEHLIVMVPQALLRERGIRLEPLMGREVGGASGITRVALEAMRTTFQELPRMTPEAAHGAGDMLADLVRLSLLELAGTSTAATQLEALRDRIRGYIGQHLRDPQLSIEAIAKALNCSRRHLYNAFADEQDTLAHYLLRQRLQACMRDLRNPLLSRTITEVAFSWGFSNVAYFSRVFRQETGKSPSEYRQSSLQPG